MQALLSIFIKVLMLKVALLGCTPNCTVEQKADFASQTQVIEQELTDWAGSQTTDEAPLVQAVDNPPAAAPVVEAPAPIKPVFTVKPTYTTEEIPQGNIRITYTWATNVPATATLSLCVQRDACMVQGTTDDTTWTVQRPGSGVEWVQISLSDDQVYNAQRPQN